MHITKSECKVWSPWMEDPWVCCASDDTCLATLQQGHLLLSLGCLQPVMAIRAVRNGYANLYSCRNADINTAHRLVDLIFTICWPVDCQSKGTPDRLPLPANSQSFLYVLHCFINSLDCL